MQKKSLFTSTVISALLLVVIMTSLPLGATAQLIQYYGSYNAAPRWSTIGNQTVVQGQTLSATAFATDDNGDPITYGVVELPTGANFNQYSRVFSFTPNYSQIGSFRVVLSATDGKSPAVYATFYVNVTTGYGHYIYGGGAASNYYNQAPYFTATTSHYAVSSGSNLRFTINAVDPENQELRYSVAELPAGASFDAAARAFSWTPATSQRGSYTLKFYATDGYAMSVPLSVTIAVDGGGTQGLPYYGSATSYYPNQCSPSVAPTYATAGTVYTYQARACSLTGTSAIRYQLTLGPNGATLDPQTGLLSWPVPKNAVNKEYNFNILASSDYAASVNQAFTVLVQGGVPEVNTIVIPRPATVQYVSTPTTPSPTVQVNAGRTVVPVNYRYYEGTAYGTMLPAQAVSINVFNIAVRVNADKEMLVSWDTNKPATGEVVFGYASQARGSDLNRLIMNYDFTTGELEEAATRHEASLGKLDTNRTYYLRVISRADTQTEISREIVFIPMATSEGSIIINQSEGAATAADTLGSFLVSSGFLFFLLLVMIGLIVYLIVLSRRPSTAAGQNSYPHAPEHLVFHPEEHR